MGVRDKLDIAANVATVGVAVLVSAALIKLYFAPPSRSVPGARPAAASPGPQPQGEAVVGASLKDRIPGVDWRKNGRTLVLAISTQCHFCRDSAPFYRELHDQVGKVLRTVAVLPQPVGESTKFLESEGIRLDQVKQLPMENIGVEATPTLLLVNKAGVVTNAWVGELQSDQQEQVLADLRKG